MKFAVDNERIAIANLFTDSGEKLDGDASRSEGLTKDDEGKKERTAVRRGVAPVNKKAWATRFCEMAFCRVLVICCCPTTSSKSWGLHFLANTK